MSRSLVVAVSCPFLNTWPDLDKLPFRVKHILSPAARMASWRPLACEFQLHYWTGSKKPCGQVGSALQQSWLRTTVD